MRRVVALLLIAILGTMPLAGMSGPAGSGSPETQDMPCHESATKSEPASGIDCDSCKTAGMCCTAFMPSAPAFSASVDAGAGRIAGHIGIAAGIATPPLDPPPLAL
jgi:hypothetical protein